MLLEISNKGPQHFFFMILAITKMSSNHLIDFYLFLVSLLFCWCEINR